MGDSIRGLLPHGRQHTNLKEFIGALRNKFQLSTAHWTLYMETQTWKTNGDWPRFHTMINAHRQFLDKTLEPALMVHMINGIDPYHMRKVVKEPRVHRRWMKPSRRRGKCSESHHHHCQRTKTPQTTTVYLKQTYLTNRRYLHKWTLTS